MTNAVPQRQHITIIILAAGSSTRMGMPKQLLPYQGRSLLRHVTEIALASSADSTVIVLGANAESMEREVAGLPVRVLHNRDLSAGLSASLRTAIAALPDHVDAALIMLCDQYLVSQELLNAMILEFRSSRKPIVACAYAGTVGVPALYDRSLFPQMLQLTGDRGAQQLIKEHLADVRSVPFPEGIADADTTADLLDAGMIQAILFDFGKVICTFSIQTFVDRLSSLTATPPSRLTDLLDHATDIVSKYETGLVSSDEFFAWFTDAGQVRLSKTAFRDAYCNIFTPIPSTFDLIRRLKPHYRLGLLSNTSEWHFEYGIKPVEVFPLFDTVTLSYEVKAMKPAEAIYRDALAKLNVRPECCVYIDDLQENVDAGRRLGLHAIRYTSHDQLLASLNRIGVTV
jgi:molybdenum cofactor cytidylyltransferase